MKALLATLATALLVPTHALATKAPVELIEARMSLQPAQTPLAAAPALPFTTPAEADVCALSLQPLPDVIALHLGEDAEAMLAFCFTQ
ncbi:MAG: hypothetical protein AAFP13_02880 [Pseudomonadota bacterium]